MDALLPLLPQRATLEGLRTCGETRRAAWEAVAEARKAVADAIAVAVGAGAATADIVRITSQSYTRPYDIPCWVHSRQGAYKAINAVADAAAAHTAAGKPGEDEALDALSAGVKENLPKIHDYELYRDVAVRVMWACADAGHSQADVAKASGFASAAAYKYLGLRGRWNRVRAALEGAGLLQGRESITGFPLISAQNWGHHIVVRNMVEESDVQRELRAALAGVGERLGAGRCGDWVLVKPQDQDSAE